MTKPPLEPLQTVKGRYYQPEQPPGDDLEHVFAANAVSRVGRALFGPAWADGERGDRWREVTGYIAAAARTGEIESYAKYAGYSSIAPEKWADADITLTFVSSKFAPFGSTRYWLFFSRRGLLALLYKMEAVTDCSAPFEFDMTAQRWRLHDAAVWVATGGQATTTQAVADGNLEAVGCKLLFAKLAQARGFGTPQITGFTLATELPGSIMPGLLERTHTGWLGHAGHLVRFYFERDPEDADGPGVIMADFKMKGHTQPMLFDLSIDRGELLKLFPPLTSDQPTIDDAHPREGEFQQLLDLMKTGTTGKSAARIIATNKGNPNDAGALYAAFRRKYKGSLRSYFRDN